MQIAENPMLTRVLRRLDTFRQEKQNWNNLYQQVAFFIYHYKQAFTTTPVSGEIQNAELNDSQALRNARVLAAFIKGMLWPSGAESFAVTSADSEDVLTADVKTFFEKVTKRMREVIDSPRSGFAKALSEYATELVVFGTAGISAFEQEDVIPVWFKLCETKMSYIAENIKGLVDVLYVVKEYSISQFIEEYGEENLTDDQKRCYGQGDVTTKIEVLHAIEPRMNRDVMKQGAMDMPFLSLHVDLKNRRILKESGFEEFPVAISRFYQAAGEVYGRSPAIDVLPEVAQINAIQEAIMLAIEKQLDPPVCVMDDGRLGGGIIDTSPGALNVLSPTGTMAPDKAIFPLFSVGDIKSAEFMVEKLQKSIENAFAIDRLLDFNNQARMTLGEVQIRDKIRGYSLTDMLSRPEIELFTPLLDRTFNILLSRGEFGVIRGSEEEQTAMMFGIPVSYIPDSVAQKIMSGKVVYKIEYISPAKRIQRMEAVLSIDSTLTFINENAQVIPDAIDNINIDEAIKLRSELTGMPTRLFRTADDVQQVRADRAAALAEKAKMEQAEQQMRMMSVAGAAQSQMMLAKNQSQNA